MLITREIDYALRVLRVLTDEERHTMKDICASEDIPQQFAYKIIRKLAEAEIIVSTRGVNGGCQLSCDLHDYSLYDLINCINPDRYINACLDPDYICTWRQKHGKCELHCRQAILQTKIDALLKAVSLYDFLIADDTMWEELDRMEFPIVEKKKISVQES